MNNVQICRTLDCAEEISKLASEIWHGCYDDIIGEPQVSYMLEKLQSKEVIANAIFDQGYRYYVMRKDGNIIGYCAVKPENEKSRMTLSKLYIKENFRGKGYSRVFMEKIISYSKELAIDMIYVVINKQNKSVIDIFRRIGFVQNGEKSIDTGNGYLTDNYIYQMYI